jgi:hypothetical protein
MRFSARASTRRRRAISAASPVVTRTDGRGGSCTRMMRCS